MERRPYSQGTRAALWVAALAAALAALAPAAGAAPRLRAPAADGARASAAREAARVRAYWTPRRMRAARPLGGTRLADPLATASFAPVADATVPPFSVNGRLFLRQGRESGYCSGTAIDSPTRRLVLTAGHCTNSGPRGRRGRSAWSHYVLFVPAYTDGTAPFGKFVAHRRDVFAPRPWVRHGNPNFDVGAFLVGPNAAGVQVADAVGGGATIGLNLRRRERFETFGYPQRTRRLQSCASRSAGEDRLTRRIPGPPTVRIRCRWLPGASGGGWLVDGGATVNGLTSYGRNRDAIHTFGPYFGAENVGRLVAGL